MIEILERRKDFLNAGLNHFDEAGKAIMVDVSKKILTERIAVASGKIFVGGEIYSARKKLRSISALTRRLTVCTRGILSL